MAAAMMNGMREMEARFPGVCSECGERFPAGAPILWQPGRAMHAGCKPQPTADQIAAETARLRSEAIAREVIAAEQARADAEHKIARAAQRKQAAAERKSHDAELLAHPVVRYGKTYDSINSEHCGRCGGTGQMPFAVYSGLCFKCNGTGRVFAPQVKQPKVATTADGPETAKVGDVLKHGGTLYRVTSFTWTLRPVVFMQVHHNQKVHMQRLVDGDTHLCLMREVLVRPLVNGVGALEALEVSPAMHGQPATQDDAGQWVTF